MKALLLAAGFGTRLLPYTSHTPKPLFPIAGRPLMDHIIRQLEAAGCHAILINTHHLHQRVEEFVSRQAYRIPVFTRFEPEILGTGGAIKNAADFWDSDPFLVVNSDIVTDIDFREVYEFHCRHPHPVTMVLHDYREFNQVSMNPDGMVVAFHEKAGESDTGPSTRLAFTGIQVIDPEILEYIPEKTFRNSIDVYRQVIQNGRGVKACVVKNHHWCDIGTVESYRRIVYEAMAPEAFDQAFGQRPPTPIQRSRLKGDGSDRAWYRLASDGRSLVMVDHGIRTSQTVCEVDSFIAIGRHLSRKGVPVPRIHLADAFSGLVFLEDLGDIHLQQVVLSAEPEDVKQYYRRIIDLLFHMATNAAEDFDPSQTYQTPAYTRELILSRECGYFLEAFVGGYLGLTVSFNDMAPDCERLVEEVMKHAVTGFMHRDFQSRNIMVNGGRIFFIDFQGGRLGPVQYDLASLLLDPYVALPFGLQLELLEYAVEKAVALKLSAAESFRYGFRACALTRNLQILGAYGFLSRVKGKTDFEQFIPQALKSLHHNLNMPYPPDYPAIRSIVNRIRKELP
ncbi:MAG: sugar phosphate nucleotidyltransferase [Thermodesulfobacteriota bacterium]